MLVLLGNTNKKWWRNLIHPPLLLLSMLFLLTSCSKRESTGTTAQRTFHSPQAAGQAVFDAAKSGDQNTLLAIFGPGGKDLIFSGDAVKDKNTAERFVSAYEQMNRWAKGESGEEVLYIGADNFAFPIPLKQNTSGQWLFDTDAGRDEVLARRVGDGELTAIGVLTEIANAQHEYFHQYHRFAQEFVSHPGQHDGLYWPISEGQRPSPLGRLADVAKALGYSRSDSSQPFNGYSYRILTRQSDAAEGGAKDYLQNGKLTGGFAIVAWPAKYRDSGIMTFVVGEDGAIRQRDLGENTAEVSQAMEAYDPTKDWAIVLTPEASASPGSKPIGE